MIVQEYQSSGGLVSRCGLVFERGGMRTSKLMDIAKRDAFRNIVKVLKNILRHVQRWVF